MNQQLEQLLKNAKAAARVLMKMPTDEKNKALLVIADALDANVEGIIEANKADLKAAQDNGMSKAMQDRLLLDEKRIRAIANDVRKVATLDDPIGEVIREMKRPNGLVIKQVRVPIGVFGIIYESRPNVTVDIATLCLKSGNVCVLKGGKEAINSNKKLVEVMNEAVKDLLPVGTISLVTVLDRSIVGELITANEYVDVVVPRGGAGLIQFVVKNASVPVIETGAGICHLYVDKDADMDMAIKIAINAKIQRPSVCNAIETILVHKDVAEVFLPKLVDAFVPTVQLKGDDKTRAIIDCAEATDQDFHTEYDDYIVNIKVVDTIEEAVDHIFNYSTKHSETIVTDNDEAAAYFMDALDSACVYHNASTRFSDGGEFGFGAELGISTQKLHARGPLGLREMCSFKYMVYGDGQVRQ
ncbi:MAG: glutamate-5-semialdehyde dehydrogenase [Erysipelotrichaceae bacterium]|nr:glutamate-5-semialdehyde dehydrogenase [Erysipelotrichaceae bacterium]